MIAQSWMRVGSALLIVANLLGQDVHGWSFDGPRFNNNNNLQNRPSNDCINGFSRRSLLQKVCSATAIASVLATTPKASHAASVPSSDDLRKLQLGHARVQYLLKEWDKETQICGKIVMSDTERKQIVRTEGSGSAGCEKTPLRVQEFMGFKSTTDPLYRADKLMVKAASLVDPDQLEDYLDAVERYKDKADNTALMAYTSSWGEANPNGSKEVIDEYLERTKADVVDSERYLRQILGFLQLEVLPPSQ